jgi:cytochrome c peroxidase
LHLWLVGASFLFVLLAAVVQLRQPAPIRRAALALTSISGAFLIGAFALTPGIAELPARVSGDGDAQLGLLLKAAGVYAPTNPPPPPEALVRLGEALFWDPEISGNRDTTCATCHHPMLATGDNLSVPIGTGGFGLGEQRQMGTARELVARNAPPVFNLGYTEWTVFFWDGRVFGVPETGFHSPASDRLPEGLDNLLAAQAMFPVTSRDEMRGNRGDRDIFGAPNELAMIPDYTVSQVWKALMVRLLAIPEYVELFHAAYPGIPVDELGFQHAANAMSAYQSVVFTFEDSPFDRYLRGDTSALSEQAKQGAALFYGEAGCASCHSGPLLTDQQFYNLAVPQIGPGKGREQPLDLGRARETGQACDRYAFRTPPLRNVAISGPWMHNGAFTNLEAAVRHHFAPLDGLQNYDPAQLAENLEDTCQEQPEVLAGIMKTYRPIPGDGLQLAEIDVQALLAFLEALTSPSALNLDHTIPASVPSGLAVGGN